MAADGDTTRLENLEGQGRWRLVMGLAVAAGLLLAGGWKWWEARRYRRAMVLVTDQIDQGLHALAARNLVDLLAWKPDSDEAAYWLGACERSRGRAKEAAAAWDGVPPSSTFWPRAIGGRVELEIEHGRLAGAEELIAKALKDPRVDGSDASILLGPIFSH
jgi:hypothetical protein